MTFAAPAALFGLILAGIPILLHLLARREPPTVQFPATRYLADAAKQHQQRLKLQHLLLMALRTLLVVALVLAAAGPSLPKSGLGNHAPTALVLVVDNSLSSGVIEGGEPALDRLRQAARDVLGKALPNDRLWLVDADLIPWPGDRASLERRVDSLKPSTKRLDLGSAVTLGAGLLAAADRPGEITVVSDLQATALSAAPNDVPIAVLRPSEAPAGNAGLTRLLVGTQPWSQDGGNAGVEVVGPADRARSVTVTAQDLPPKQLLVRGGGQGTAHLSGLPAGWSTITAALDPDELRGDDARTVAVRVSPPARVSWNRADRFLATAADVLVQNGRISPGADVNLGALGGGASIVMPPADPAAIGAMNRTLAARGSRWRFGDLDLVPATTDSGPWLGRERVVRRHRLVFQGGAPTDVLVTVNGQPWAARSGRIILLGSRLDPEWTDLPIAAGFLPFVDALVNRAARGDLASLAAAPGDPVLLPDRVTTVATGAEQWRVEGGAAFRPPRVGVYYLIAERDTLGTLSVNPDPKESDLTRATDAETKALWPRSRVESLDRATVLAFQAGAASDLRGPLLWLAALLGLAEVFVASVWRRRS